MNFQFFAGIALHWARPIINLALVCFPNQPLTPYVEVPAEVIVTTLLRDAEGGWVTWQDQNKWAVTLALW